MLPSVHPREIEVFESLVELFRSLEAAEEARATLITALPHVDDGLSIKTRVLHLTSGCVRACL